MRRPAFEIATAPTGTRFNEATFTDSGPVARLIGGNLESDTAAPTFTPNAGIAPTPLTSR
jgi:hypothetical protein